MGENLKAKEKELEALLGEAGQSPAARPEFYRRLLESELYLLGEGPANGIHAVGEPRTIRVESFQFADGMKTPAFTSQEKLQLFLDRMQIAEARHFIRMPARTVFESINNNPLMLNPGSDVAKELLPAEIESLLDGSIFREAEKITIQEQTEVYYGQPAEYPNKLVGELVKLFVRRSEVKAAYLALMVAPSMDNQMSYVIGIDHAGDFEVIINDIIVVARDVLEKGKTLTFEDLSGQAGTKSGKEYLMETAPFYRRKNNGVLSKVLAWFGRKDSGTAGTQG